VIEAIDQDLTEEFPLWRLVFEKISLHELETTWSLDDMIKANTVLDIQNTVQALYMEGLTNG
jgi:hypothetical protein